MKKQFKLITTLVIVFFVAACKKDTISDNNKPKDYSASVINKTWWGTFAYKGQTEEYYSMHFNADNTLDWDQFLGSFKGFWKLDSNRLTITFVGNDTKITAKIGDDNKLSQFSDNTDFSEIKSGQLVENPNISLDKTKWIGTGELASNPIDLELNFQGESQLFATFSTPTSFSKYSRSSTGGTIRSNITGIMTFLVIVSETEMYGVLIDYKSLIHVTKQ